MIYVCNLAEMPHHVEALRPSHLISLLPPEELPPTPACLAPTRHLRLGIHDICEPLPGAVTPDVHHVEALIEFLHGWSGEGPLLIHCLAGISRSMASALIALNYQAPGREAATARQMRELAPHAHPNRRLVLLADELLRREGRLLAARDAMGPAVPLDAGPLVCLTPEGAP